MITQGRKVTCDRCQSLVVQWFNNGERPERLGLPTGWVQVVSFRDHGSPMGMIQLCTDCIPHLPQMMGGRDGG
jgi:hypothetical protein